MVSIFRFIFLLFCFLPLLSGCEKAETAGIVKASPAYLRYFGEPPTVREGTCFARVLYYPLAEHPSQVMPVPVFIFGEETQPERLVRHLVGMDPDSLGKALVNPFPPGTKIASLRLEGNTAEVELELPEGLPEELPRVQAIASSLGHSLAQYPEIERARISANGELLPHLEPDGFLPDPRDVAEPGAPRLIGAAGSWEGEESPREVLIHFDRPVRIGNLEVEAGGKPLEGDYFQSMFDMTAVIHPARPEALSEGMTLQVRWEITDAMGRDGSGVESVPLRRFDQPAGP